MPSSISRTTHDWQTAFRTDPPAEKGTPFRYFGSPFYVLESGPGPGVADSFAGLLVPLGAAGAAGSRRVSRSSPGPGATPGTSPGLRAGCFSAAASEGEPAGVGCCGATGVVTVGPTEYAG